MTDFTGTVSAQPAAAVPPAAQPGANATSRKANSNYQNDLWKKTIIINSRPYYFDLRENFRGRYLKITEVSDLGRRTLLLSIQGVPRLLDAIKDAVNENYDKEGGKQQVVPDSDKPPSVLLFSRIWKNQKKKFYFDLMQSSRGLYMKLVEVQPEKRTVILLPNQGWSQVVDALEEMQKTPSDTGFVAATLTSLEPSPTDPDASKKTISSKLVLVPPKKFYFDLQENELGKFCKIAEVQYDKRNTVMLPTEAFNIFIEQLKCYLNGDFKTVVDGTSVAQVGQPDESLVSSRIISWNSKQFFLDIRQNKRGRFLKLSEVKDTRKHHIFVPDAAFDSFKQALEAFVEM